MTPRGARAAAVLLGAAFFAAYLLTASGGLPPYRDAGEMTAAAWTLGVAHPPGYPLYILLGKAASLLPLGSAAYRMNLLAALGGGAAVGLTAWALLPAAGPWAFVGAALLGLNPVFWHAATVPEMYTLGLAFAAAAWGLALRARSGAGPGTWRLLGLVYGLALALRADLLLLAPALALTALPSWRALSERRRELLQTALCAAAGLSVYLYLPIRSLTEPWLDWGDPSSLGRLWDSLSRRSYGGSLDLVARSYAPGENFPVNLARWAGHLGDTQGPLLGAALLGLTAAGAGPLAAVAFSAVLFLLLANLPPNPHAMAIIDPHYLAADLWLAGAAALGLARAASSRWGRACLPLVLVGLAFVLTRPAARDRRWLLDAEDYARSVLRPLPGGAALVGRKDVQLFGLWQAQAVAGKRRDVAALSQGLSGTPWYRAAVLKENGLRLERLGRDEPGGWGLLLRQRPAWATLDAELPPAVSVRPWGLSLRLAGGGGTGAEDRLPWMRTAALRRAPFKTESPDFFSGDLREAFSLGWQRQGSAALDRGEAREAERALRTAWALRPASPEPPLFLGLAAFRGGRTEDAARYFAASARRYDEVLESAAEFKALPAVRDGLRRESAHPFLNGGAAAERLGRRDEAERLYLAALERDPAMAQAHYNLAVLYWGRDWTRTRRELEATLRLDPAHAEAARFLGRIPR